MMIRNEERVPRFSFEERAIHWLAALSFLYAALTGLALWSPRLFWLASIFGGGNTVRGWHPWGGVIFSLTLGFMFRNWAAQMRLDAEDRAWLRQAHRYAMHDEEGLPEAGRFNAGQKMLFWTQFDLDPVSVLQWFGSLVSRNHASFTAFGGYSDSPDRSHHLDRRHHRSHLHGHRRSSRSLSRHDSGMGTPQLGSLAPPQVVPGN